LFRIYSQTGSSSKQGAALKLSGLLSRMDAGAERDKHQQQVDEGEELMDKEKAICDRRWYVLSMEVVAALEFVFSIAGPPWTWIAQGEQESEDNGEMVLECICAFIMMWDMIFQICAHRCKFFRDVGNISALTETVCVVLEVVGDLAFQRNSKALRIIRFLRLIRLIKWILLGYRCNLLLAQGEKLVRETPLLERKLASLEERTSDLQQQLAEKVCLEAESARTLALQQQQLVKQKDELANIRSEKQVLEEAVSRMNKQLCLARREPPVMEAINFPAPQVEAVSSGGYSNGYACIQCL